MASTCRWDLGGKGQRPGADFRMEANMAVSPVDVSLAGGLRTGTVTAGNSRASLTWSGAGAPRSSLRFETPQVADGRTVVSAAGGKVTGCSPGTIEVDAQYCVLDMLQVYGRRGAQAKVTLAPAG